MDITQLDLNLLTTLKVLLEERHITHAARRLNISQPAASRKLGQLREIFHDSLLVRVGTRMEPTAFALSLEPMLVDLLTRAGSIVNSGTFDPQTSELSVTIAVTDFWSQTAIPTILNAMRRMCPGLKLHVRLWQRIRPMELLLGEVDCAKCHFRDHELPPGLKALYLEDRVSVCLMSKEHPLAGEELTLENYLRYPHVSYLYDPACPNWLDEALARQGRKRNITAFYPSVLGAVLMLPGSDLILSTTQRVADAYAGRYNLVSVPNPIEITQIPEYFVWPECRDLHPGHRWFREHFLRLMRIYLDSP